jgi:serine/threonine-protein kinase HipA
MVGHTSISGMQGKISVKLSQERAALQVAIEGGNYILKPDTKAYPELPANEHVTMLIAGLAGIQVPPLGLIRLADDTLAYVVARFDRTDSGKLRVEDCCQLEELPPRDYFKGSYEAVVRLLRAYASEPPIEILKLYRQVVFAWWTGNGDMHRKNISLLTTPEGHHVLSPAYDLLCTRLVLPEDSLALTVDGRKDRVTAANWDNFAKYCRIPRRAADRVTSELVAAAGEAKELIAASYLSGEMKAQYIEVIDERTETLST